MTRVGVVGLGAIGAGVARAVLGAGHQVTVCDVRPEATVPLVDAGARAAASAAELAAAADVALVAVVDDTQLRAVVAGPDGLLAGAARGTRIVVLSTVAVATLVDLAATAAGSGVALIDCGVSGGPGAAPTGRLVAMVGGDEADVDAVRPVLAAACQLVEHMGPLGAGMRAKLARNLVQYASWLAAYEGQVLAEAAGIDLAAFARVIRTSDKVIGGVTTLMLRDTVAPLPADSDAGWLELMRATAVLAHKDLRAALELADELGVELPTAQLTDQRYDRVLGLGPDARRSADG